MHRTAFCGDRGWREGFSDRLPAVPPTVLSTLASLRLFLLAHEVSEDVDGHREYDRSVLFVPYAAQGLLDEKGEKGLTFKKGKQGCMHAAEFLSRYKFFLAKWVCKSRLLC